MKQLARAQLTVYPSDKKIVHLTHSGTLARGTARCMRAHVLHTPLRKQLMLSVNPTDPSWGPRTSDATRCSLASGFRRSVGSMDRSRDGSFHRAASTAAFAALPAGARETTVELAHLGRQYTWRTRKSFRAHPPLCSKTPNSRIYNLRARAIRPA